MHIFTLASIRQAYLTNIHSTTRNKKTTIDEKTEICDKGRLIIHDLAASLRYAFLVSTRAISEARRPSEAADWAVEGGGPWTK